MMDSEERKEYRAIEIEAELLERSARVEASRAPKLAQIHATLAISARLEALSYAIRHATITVDTLL